MPSLLFGLITARMMALPVPGRSRMGWLVIGFGKKPVLELFAFHFSSELFLSTGV